MQLGILHNKLPTETLDGGQGGKHTHLVGKNDVGDTMSSGKHKMVILIC